MSRPPTDLSTQEKRELLSQKLRKRIQQPVVAPASSFQKLLWVLDQLGPGNPTYNIFRALKVLGNIDVDAVRRVLNEIVRRHESLRTTMRFEGGEPFQVIGQHIDLPLRTIDLSRLAHDEQEREVVRLAREEARTPFNLSTGPLVRATLLRQAPDEHVALLTIHHVISDGWSIGVFIAELGALYYAFSNGRPSPLPEPLLQFRDFAQWQRTKLQGDATDALLSYWKHRLQGAPQSLELQTDHPRPQIMTFAGTALSSFPPKQLSTELRTLSSNEGTTLFMTMLAAFSTLLYRYTNQTDLVIATPTAGRERPETEGVIGFLANVILLRVDLSGNPTFRDLMRRVRNVALEAYAHQELPFEKLVEELHLPRDFSRAPLSQVVFALQNMPIPALAYPGLSLTPIDIDTGISRSDVMFEVFEQADGLRFRVEYSTNLFEGATIERFMDHYRELLHQVVANPDQRLSDIHFLTDSEKAQLLVDWNATRTDFPNHPFVHDLFAGQADRSPEAVAVVLHDTSMSYRELNRRANQVAHHLRGLGIGAGDLVGIHVERGPEMIVGLLGILKAGAAYLPLDPDHPRERIAFILEDTHARMVLTQQRLMGNISPSAARLVCLDADWNLIADESTENLNAAITGENLAYVIYTSGSTGRPKGVAIEHRSLLNHVQSCIGLFGLDATHRQLQFFPLGSDASVEEIFPSLCCGGSVFLDPDVARYSPMELLFQCEQFGVTKMAMPASHWHELVQELSASDRFVPESLKIVLTGAEPPSSEKFRQWKRLVRHPIRFFNVYGPTEATVLTTAFEVPRESGSQLRSPGIPIGRPLPNTRVYLLDQDLQLVPLGVPGELCIGGIGLARGYLNRPELTAEKFIKNPFNRAPGARLYRTGDLARYLPDGNLEFVGRIDHQIKIRGFRIELGEVEHAILQHHLVEEALASVREDNSGDKRLVAYFIPKRGAELTGAELLGFLQGRLPPHMVPSFFVSLPSFPKTPNGKVDRNALPAPEGQRPEFDHEYLAPRTADEQMLADIWCDLLKIDKVGVHDNFFAMGGHSLLAVRAMYRVRELVHIDLPVRILFESPTVAELAKRIEHIRSAREVPPDRQVKEMGPIMPMQTGHEAPNIFCVHPVGGTINCYKHFARVLGQYYNVIGIQSRALADPAQEHQTLTSMVNAYAAAICYHCPQEPYYLIGYSSGGVLAIALADALESIGHDVALVGLIDTSNEGDNPAGVEEDSIPNLLLALRATLEDEHQSFGDLWDQMLPQAEPFLDELRPLSTEERLERISHWLAGMSFDYSEVKDLLSRQIKLVNLHISLMRAHTLSRIRAPLTFWSAKEGFPGLARDRTDWGEYSSAGVETVELQGNHFSIMRPPLVQTLAERMIVRIEKAGQSGQQ